MLRYAITDRHLQLQSADTQPIPLASQCAEVAQHGADLLLIREKDLAAGELATLSRSVLAAVRATPASTRILIAGRPDIALAVGADGVHLSAAPGELTPAHVRRLLPQAFVSVSCHTLAEVARARDHHPSAILFGPIFAKVAAGVEVLPGIGLDLLQQACALAAPVPVLALGGITLANTPACLAAGAAGIAAIRLFFSPERQLAPYPEP